MSTHTSAESKHHHSLVTSAESHLHSLGSHGDVGTNSAFHAELNQLRTYDSRNGESFSQDVATMQQHGFPNLQITGDSTHFSISDSASAKPGATTSVEATTKSGAGGAIAPTEAATISGAGGATAPTEAATISGAGGATAPTEAATISGASGVTAPTDATATTTSGAGAAAAPTDATAAAAAGADPLSAPGITLASSFKGGDNAGSPGMEAFAEALLQKLNLPSTGQAGANNIQFLEAWQQAEGGGAGANGDAWYNPFNTSLPEGNSTGINSDNVQTYQTLTDGINATASTLQQSNMSGILQALQQGADPMVTAQALAASPWGTGAGVENILQPGSASSASTADQPAPAPAPGQTGPSGSSGAPESGMSSGGGGTGGGSTGGGSGSPEVSSPGASSASAPSSSSDGSSDDSADSIPDSSVESTPDAGSMGFSYNAGASDFGMGTQLVTDINQALTLLNTQRATEDLPPIPDNSQTMQALAIIISHESSGNPNAANNSDSNAAAGNASQGLMQTTGTTFSSNHVTGTSSNILDPVANIAAGINYAVGRYGSLSQVPGVASVTSGGAYKPY